MQEGIRFLYGERPVSDYVRMWAEKAPSRVAINFYGKLISYKQLDELSNRLAAALHDMGYRKGDRIGFYGQTSPQAFITYLAGIKSGLVSVPLDPMYKEFELEYALTDAEVNVVVCFGDLYPIIRQVKDKTKVSNVIVTDFEDYTPEKPSFPLHRMMLESHKQLFDDTHDFPSLIKRYLPEPPKVDLQMSECEWVMYTGGTTGPPKGCLHTHYNSLLGGLGTAQLAYKSSENDILLVPFPASHISSICLAAHPTWVSGMTLVPLARWDPVAAMEAIDKYKVTLTTFPMPCYTDIIEHPDVHKYDLTSLRVSVGVSFVQELSEELIERWQQLTGIPIYTVGFRMTEHFGYSTTGCFIPFEKFNQGPPNPGVELKIVDPEDRGRELPAGERGEIVVKSPARFEGYLNKPEETKQDLVDGWHYTGDVGQLGSNGMVYFYGRYRDVIKVSGYSVAPKEVEVVGLRHPAIDKIAVIGVPDTKKGEVPKAFVSLKPGFGLEASELEAWFKAHISAIKVPKVEIRQQLPLSTKGEVLKIKLEQEEAARQ